LLLQGSNGFFNQRFPNYIKRSGFVNRNIYFFSNYFEKKYPSFFYISSFFVYYDGKITPFSSNGIQLDKFSLFAYRIVFCLPRTKKTALKGRRRRKDADRFITLFQPISAPRAR